LAALGLWYDDIVPGGSPVTPDLLNVVTYNTGVNANDTAFKTSFPFVQTPWSGDHNCSCDLPPSISAPNIAMSNNASQLSSLGYASPGLEIANTPNPIGSSNTLRYHVAVPSHITIGLYDASGKQLKVLVNENVKPGTYIKQWSSNGIAKGSYFVSAMKDHSIIQTLKLVKD
jgi:hypothetical protein